MNLGGGSPARELIPVGSCGFNYAESDFKELNNYENYLADLCKAE